MDRVDAVLQSSPIDSKKVVARKRKELDINHKTDKLSLSFVKNSASNHLEIAPSSLVQPPAKFARTDEDNRHDSFYMSATNERGVDSPPPPALSPASMSPAHSSVFNTSSRPSPAPPVIIEDEISSSMSNNPPNIAFLTYQNAPILAPKSYVQRNCESSDSSSSSTSSSSSNAASSDNSPIGDVEPLKPTLLSNGLPILEKAPVLPFVASPIHQPMQSPLKLAKQVEFSELAKASSPVAVPNEAVEVTRVTVVKKPARKASTKRKRPQKKSWPRGDDYDYETGGKRSSILKRAEESALRKSTTRKCGGRSTNAGGSKARTHITVTEIAAQHRYLKSPYFCLCQSSMPAKTSESSQFMGSNDKSQMHPAHVINPAIITDDQVDCPVIRAATAANAGTLIAGSNPKSLVYKCSPFSSELQAFFTSSRYKPSLRPGASTRDTRLSESYSEAACPSWRCIFCAETSSFLRLGPLYGPYFLAPSIQARFAPSPSLRLIIKAISPPAGGSISIRSAQQVPLPPQMKKRLRKTKKRPVASTTLEEAEAQLEISRIGREGEVWLHMECVLWAPGTYLQGDGKIAGLDDAVAMALETICSHCKKHGAILSCRNHGCNLCYHYNCARLAECHFNEEQFTVLCKKHYVYS